MYKEPMIEKREKKKEGRSKILGKAVRDMIHVGVISNVHSLTFLRGCFPSLSSSDILVSTTVRRDVPFSACLRVFVLHPHLILSLRFLSFSNKHPFHFFLVPLFFNSLALASAVDVLCISWSHTGSYLVSGCVVQDMDRVFQKTHRDLSSIPPYYARAIAHE